LSLRKIAGRAGIAAMLFVCSGRGMVAQPVAFVCTPASPEDQGSNYIGVFSADYQYYSGTYRIRGFTCRNTQPVAVEFTGIDPGPSTGTFSGFAIWGFCINRLCVDGSFRGSIPPSGLITIPVAFLPTEARAYSQTFRVLNGSGFAATTLTVTGLGLAVPTVPTLSGAGFLAMIAGMVLSGLAVLCRR
jgi:hypothetical protein